MEDILSQALKSAQEAEVYQVTSEETPVRFETNRLKQILTRQGTVTALRLVKDGRTGFSTTSRQDGAGGLVSMALAVSPFGALAKFDFPARQTYHRVSVFDPDAEKMTREEMTQVGQCLIDAVRANTPELICEASFTRAIAHVRLLNSHGGKVNFRRSFFSLNVEGVLTRGTDMLFVGDSEASSQPIKEFRTIADRVITQLENSRRQAAVSSGSLPVVFNPRSVAQALMMPLAVAFNGRVVLQGASPLGKKLGEKVFDEQFSLSDDATIPYAPRSCPCDDEGVPGRRTALVEEGRVTSFLYDLQTAGQAGARSTGNGSRSTGGLPSIQPGSLVIGQGKVSPEELVRNMKEGLVIEEVMGAEQGNVLGGDFGGNVLLGYKVENGEIVGRVKNTMISGNVYDILKGGLAFSNQSRWVGGMLKTPHLYVERLSVSSKV